MRTDAYILQVVSPETNELVSLEDVTDIEYEEDYLDPFCTLSFTCEPTNADAESRRRLLKRGNRVILIVNGAKQHKYLIDSVTMRLERKGGVSFQCECSSAVKMLTEARVDETYTRHFEGQSGTMYGVVVDVLTHMGIQDVFIVSETEDNELEQKVGLKIVNKDVTPKGRKKTIDDVQAHQNETAWAFLTRTATRHGLLIRAGFDGNIMISKPKPVGTAPLYSISTDNYGRDNIISIEERTTNDNQFSECKVWGNCYEFKGEKRTKHPNATILSSDIFGKAGPRYICPDIPTKRLIIHDREARTPARCTNIGTLALGARAERSEVVTVQLHGLSNPSGGIYTVNTVVQVKVKEVGINAPYLIISKSMSISRAGGQLTTLKLIPPGTLVVSEES